MDDIIANIPSFLEEKMDYKGVQVLQECRGGLVNKAVAVATDQGMKFVKYANRQNAFDMFNSEVESLRLIKETGAIKIPNPVKVLNYPEGGAILIMEFLENLKTISDENWGQLGTKVARIHKHNLDKLSHRDSSSVHEHRNESPGVDKFGFHATTYFGPNFCTQPVWCDTWEEYFMKYMLKPQFDLMEQSQGKCELVELWSELSLHLHKAYKTVELKPSLVHGDFCSINIGEVGNGVVIFDPCSMYAPAEQDFTILEMEENFAPAFYDSYSSILPPFEDPASHLRRRARLLFAQLLISNIPTEVDLTKDAIENCTQLVKLLKNDV